MKIASSARVLLACAAALTLASCKTEHRVSVESWTFIPSEELGTGGPFNPADIVSGGPAFVAAGSIETAGGGSVAAAWYSEDGKKWAKSHSVDLAPSNAAENDIRFLAKLGQTIVAVGTRSDGERLLGLEAWTTKDGKNWTREQAIPEPPEGEPLALSDVAPLNDSVFVLGSGYFWRRDSSGVWTVSAYTLNDDQCEPIDGLASTSLGLLLVGRCHRQSEDEPYRASIYSLGADGRTVDMRTDPPFQQAIDATTVGPTTVVLGYEKDTLGNGNPAYSTRSEDAPAWAKPSRLPTPAGMLRIDAKSIHQVKGSLLISGFAAAPDSSIHIAVWASGDRGKTWNSYTLPSRTTDEWMERIAEHDGLIIGLVQAGYGPIRTTGIVVNS